MALGGSDALTVSNSLPDELPESESVRPQFQESDKITDSSMQKKTFQETNFAIIRTKQVFLYLLNL